MKRIYLIRHGESTANRDHRVPGRDTPLSEHGERQAAMVAERLRHLDIDALIASDFTRAQQTATPTVEVLGLPLAIESAVGEFWEPSHLVGVPDDSAEILAYRRARRERIDDDPHWHEGDGESFAGFFDRLATAEANLLAHPAERIAVFSHAYYLMGFVSRILLEATEPSNQWLRHLAKLRVSNTGITLLEHHVETGWRLIMLNDHAHFAE